MSETTFEMNLTKARVNLPTFQTLKSFQAIDYNNGLATVSITFHTVAATFEGVGSPCK